MADTRQAYDVFLSHERGQKRCVTDTMYTLLRQVPGVSVFMDEHSLVPGDSGWDTVVQAAERARIAVVVLTKEFAAKRTPMDELRIFLHRHRDPNDSLVIVPVLPEDSWECFKQVDELYKGIDEAQRWPHGSKPDDATLSKWAARIEELVGITCIRGDQEQYYQGKLASRAVDVVVRRLADLGRLPAGFVWNTSLNWQWVQLPARRPAVVGREDEVERMVAALEGHPKAAVLEGPAGVGKTTVALEAAWELCDRGRCTGGAFVIDFAGFLPGSSPKSWLASSLYQQLAACKGIHPPKSDSWDSIFSWLKHCAHGSVLLLLENFEDVTRHTSTSSQDPLTQELLGMFENLSSICGRFGRTVLVLLGSRYYNYPLVGGATHVRLGALSLPDAVQVLKLTTSGSNVDWGEDLPQQLAGLLECHPLTLEMIGSFIKLGRCTPQEVVDSMTASGRIAAAVPTAPHAMGLQPYLHAKRISREWLRRVLARKELSVLQAVAVFRGSFLAEGAVAVGAGTAGTAVQGMQALLDGLVALNVLRHDVDGMLGQRYAMHLLVRQLLVDATEATRLQLLHWMAEHPRGPGQTLVKHRAAGDDPRLDVCHEVLLHEQLNFREAVHLLRCAKLTRQHSDVLTALIKVGTAMSNHGDLAGARGLEEAVLQKCKQLLGDANRATLISMTNLAHTMSRQGDLAGARGLLAALLQKRKQLLGDDHPDTLTSMANLAVTMYRQGNLAGARGLEEAVLKKRKQLLGDDHPDTLKSMANLSVTMIGQGDLACARGLQEAVLEKSKQLLGGGHPDTLISMTNLAATMHRQGDMAGAWRLEEAVLQMRKQLLGDDHPDTLTSMNNLAATITDQGDLSGAQKLWEVVLHKRKQLLGDNHPDTLTSMANLAVTINRQGDLAGARELEEAVLQKRKQLLGDDHPDTLTSMANLAVTITDQGDLSGAQKLWEVVLHKRKQLLGDKHPGTLTSMANLAVAMYRQGNLAGARGLEQAVLQMRKQLLGDDHPQTLISMANLAATMNRQGDLAGARGLWEAVLQKRMQLLGDKHPDTLTSMANLACTMYEQGNLAGARGLWEAVLQTRKQLLGDDHPDTLRSMANLAVIMTGQGDLAGVRGLWEAVLQKHK